MTEHSVETLVLQRVVCIALVYDGLNDHDELHHDPVLATLSGDLTAKRSDRAPLAGMSTPTRLELSKPELHRYHHISVNGSAVERLFVDLFLDAHSKPPKQIILVLDATDNPQHGDREGKFFDGYYDCDCYLSRCIFRDHHLLMAKLRPSNIDGSAGAVGQDTRVVAQVRERWPKVRILLRRDSGLAREALMVWCETNQVDFSMV